MTTSAKFNDIEPHEEHDVVNSPAHYTHSCLPNGTQIECIEVIEMLDLPYHLGNTLKYLWRHNHHTRGRIENLKKARWFLNRYIAKLENAE